MTDKRFQTTDTLLEITEKFPETITVFKANGFPQMEDPEKRKLFGAKITLEVAAGFRQIDLSSFVSLLESAIDDHAELLKTGHKDKDEILVKGLLPCPIRLPLSEQVEQFTEKFIAKGNKVRFELQAASMGVDWLKDDWNPSKKAEDIADMYISAGFDMFFDEAKLGRFKSDNVFSAQMPYKNLNPDFQNDYIDLRDPMNHYSVLGVVPAVFLVNEKELNGRKIPKTWQDILSPEYEKSVSLPIGDFDLFNAILLSLYKLYGEESLKKLGRSLMVDMHPSQMVKSHKKQGARPAITIMPYFFTKMVKEGGVMKAIWPEDGAIVSPIFMLTKSSNKKGFSEIIDLFCSKTVGELMSHQGLFPSTHPEVDNKIEPTKKYNWIGWDFIYQNNIQALVNKCENIFNQGLKE
ncbi:MAG: ABC transporter substrate-binding protein [Bacteroidales bacterium]